MNPIKITDNVVIGNGRLVLLGGPCMAESRETCLETAAFLKELCAKLDIGYVFKASFDKANRSSGTSKRGPGMEKGLELLSNNNIQLVIMDLGLPGMNGIEATKRAKLSNSDLKIVILTSHNDSQEVLNSLKAGANAYCSKEINPKRLTQVVSSVLDGASDYDGINVTGPAKILKGNNKYKYISKNLI